MSTKPPREAGVAEAEELWYRARGWLRSEYVQKLLEGEAAKWERQLAEARAEWADMLHEKNIMAAERSKAVEELVETAAWAAYLETVREAEGNAPGAPYECAERPRAVKEILERLAALAEAQQSADGYTAKLERIEVQAAEEVAEAQQQRDEARRERDRLLSEGYSLKVLRDRDAAEQRVEQAEQLLGNKVFQLVQAEAQRDALARWMAKHDDVCPLDDEGDALLASLPAAQEAK